MFAFRSLASAAPGCGGADSGTARLKPWMQILAGLVLLALVACEGSVGDAIGPGDPAATGDAHRYDDAIQVTPVLEDKGAVSMLIGRSGGKITATGADGTVYTLAVPAEALAFGTTITMTPLASIDGLPFGDGPSWGVDLKPSGLFFLEPAILTIAPPTPVPVDEQIPFSYSGTELGLGVLTVNADAIELVVNHFSGYGLQRGFFGHTGEVLQRVGASAEARLQAEMQQLLGQARVRELEGAEADPAVWERFTELMREYEELVVIPRLAAARGSCDDGVTVMRFFLGWQRTNELLGIETTSRPQFSELLRDVTTQCLAEEYRMCTEEHIVHRLPMIWLNIARTFEVLGVEDSGVVDLARDLAESCMTFELEFTTTGTHEMDARGHRTTTENTADFTVKAAFDAATLQIREATAAMESKSTRVELHQPSYTHEVAAPWSGPARLLAMGWSLDLPDLTTTLGEVTDLWIEIELPEGRFPIAMIFFEGQFMTPNEANAVSIYRETNDDEIIRGWDILGDEIYAVAEWEARATANPGPGVTSHSSSWTTAVLRHTPGE